MRSLCVVFILVALTNVSCKKDVSPAATSKAFSLPGTWRLFSEVGGIAGIHKTFPVSEGHLSYTFRADSTCTTISNTDTVNAIYSVGPGTSYNCQCTKSFISIGANRFLLGNVNDTLWLSVDGISDGMAEGFVKDN